MKRLVAGAFAMAAAALAAGVANAASLEVGPIRVQMIGPERTTTINLRNSGTTPMTVQIRAVDWAQRDGNDSYVPSATLIASPPVAEIAPGQSQVVRLVVENVDATVGERSYRVILDELPAEASANGAGVQAALRALVPVFITPSLNSRPNLRWTAVRDGQNLRVSATNSGDTRERLIDMHATAGGSELANAPNGYVLSNGGRTWILPAPAAGAASVRITGEGEFGAIEVDVPITS